MFPRFMIHIFFCALLAACTNAAPLPSISTTTSGSLVTMTAVESAESSASSINQNVLQPLEQLPADLTIEHFKNMRLEGKDLKLISTLDNNAAYTRYQIEYSSNGLKISGILNIPKGDGPFPLLILNHGYIAPSVYTNGRGLKREQDYLARQGFTVLHTDYRGHAFSDPSPDTRMVYDAGLEYSMDSVNAIKAVRTSTLPELSQVDASKVGMLGHSMGGGVTLNILTAHPDTINAAVLYAPVHAYAWENFTRWHDMRDVDDKTQEALGTPETHPEKWNALSSEMYLQNVDDPVRIFHGTNDADVPYDWSVTLLGKLEQWNKDTVLITYQREGHEFGPQWTDFMEQTAAFFRENL